MVCIVVYVECFHLLSLFIPKGSFMWYLLLSPQFYSEPEAGVFKDLSHVTWWVNGGGTAPELTQNLLL